jgi:hypothetical protein
VANGKGLRLIGWTYGALTLTVALVAAIVVITQINSPVEARADMDVSVARLSR